MMRIFKKSIQLIFKNPIVVLPFLLVALFEFLGLSLWYYAPRPPLSFVLGPPIKAFIGEKFLHYPLNFLILPRLVFISRILIYLSAGVIALGMTATSIYQIQIEGKAVRFFGSFNRTLRKYPALVGAGFIYSIIAFCIYKIPRLVLAGSSLLADVSIIVYLISFPFFVLLEGALIYAPFYILISRKSIFFSLKHSVLFFKNFFISTFIFIFLFRLLNVGLFIARNNMKYLLKEYFSHCPEVALFILGFEIFLLFISNFFIISMSAQLFLRRINN